MKRSSPVKPHLLLCLLVFFINPSIARGQGVADPNYLLAFKRLYVEPVKDNVDGAFQAPVMQSFKEIFERNPRFELVGDKAQSDTIVRTVIEKNPNGMTIDISLLLTGTGELFTAEHDSVPITATGRDTGNKVKQLLKAALKRIPFYGTVTGRDAQELTFDIGAAHGLRKNDIIQVSRIDNIKRHPLLKTIVDVQLVPVGNAIVDSVEDTISFGHVKSEITGEKIQKLHKVTAIEARLPEPVSPEAGQPASSEMTDFSTESPESLESSGADGQQNEGPELGYVGLGVQLSSFSNSTSASSVSKNGSGFSPGARINTEIWLTKNWFADLTFGAAAISYDQGENPSTSYSTSGRIFSINAGYKYLPTGDLHGPQVAAKLGYSNFTWAAPVSVAELLSEKSYSGLNLGLGGLLPLAGPDWGLLFNVNVLLFPSLSEEETYKVMGTESSASGTTFFLGGYHYFNPKVAVRAGPLVEIFSADNTSGSTTSQKTFGLLTSLLYYF